MKVVIIGGTGLIGSKVIANLVDLGHETIAASPSSGVDTLTGRGVSDVVTGADVVVDVSNSPSFADDDVLHFFTTSTRHLLAAEREAGVAQHVALSVVGANVNPDSGYTRAKAAQEKLIEESGRPYSIVRATQFYEFVSSIAGSATDGDVVRLPHALIQPIAADDVATAVTRAVVGSPLDGAVEIAGPQTFGMDDFIRRGFAAQGDSRDVSIDPQAPYFGAVIDDASIVPGPSATIYPTRFDDWRANRVAVR